MNTIRKSLVGLSGLALQSLVCANAMASPIAVEWVQPEEFTDILPGNESRVRFREKLFANFEQYFNKLGKRLPQDYQLTIKMTDIDLAGDINTPWSGGFHQLRVVDRTFKTKVAFSYQLLDGQGKVVAAADEVLKANAIERFPRNAIRHESYAYEKYMIKQWFNKTLMGQVAS